MNALTLITVPEDLTTWEWLFESRQYSPLYTHADKPLGAFIDAETKERLDWAEVKLKSTALSSCFRTHYGLNPGDTVSIFGSNTIWYPVAMFAVNRAGMCLRLRLPTEFEHDQRSV